MLWSLREEISRSKYYSRRDDLNGLGGCCQVSIMSGLSGWLSYVPYGCSVSTLLWFWFVGLFTFCTFRCPTRDNVLCILCCLATMSLILCAWIFTFSYHLFGLEKL
ncbi:uncharacterized protein BO88DRAFT_115542 [Aspergillus vadensis CBS 113365]|uniref:Uncharacterized protein n=1 Tax=Aspergillus vadensis (strain CBS 113365 / IMI 142717 / IBT 24658) TaxID=1448311 RepID=A0A319B3C3_ASPVC|nr:hypothetical protein BO88DRAFT_115542 [Aspergillus vadensis CBS 113365]PYH66311.1 hypothetical protein BO88DRAFT_115542 [Aspergillus vadensis CBS 113365]